MSLTDPLDRTSVDTTGNDWAIDDNSAYVTPGNAVPDFDGAAPNFGTQNTLPVDHDYPTGEDLRAAPPSTVPLDVLDQYLHRFFTAWTDKLHPIGQRLPASNPGYLAGGHSELAGYNFLETAGQPVTIKIFDGPDAAAPLLWSIVVPANGTAQQYFAEHGPHFDKGLFLTFTGTGVPLGNVFLARKLAV